HFGASAGRADARRRDEGDVGHRRGSRASSGRAPLPRSGTARSLCGSLLTYRAGYCSALAPRQLASATKRPYYFFTDPNCVGRVAMLPRIASALVLIPMVLALVVFASPAVLLCALGILGTACLREYFHLMKKMGLRGQPWFGHAGFWFLILCLHIKLVPGELLLSLVVVVAFLVSMGRQAPMRERVTGMMVDLLGVLYLALCLYPALPIR